MEIGKGENKRRSKKSHRYSAHKVSGVKLLTVLKESDEGLTRSEGKAHIQTIRKCILNH